MSQSDNLQLEAISHASLLPFVRLARGNAVVEIIEWQRQALHGSGGGTGVSAVYRFSGKVRELGHTVP